jgi:hypothetical protein
MKSSQRVDRALMTKRFMTVFATMLLVACHDSGEDPREATPAPEIDAAETRFTAHGTLRVAFTHPVDVEEMVVEIGPERPEGLAASNPVAIAPNVVEVAISKYHLPIAYTLIVSLTHDGEPLRLEHELAATGNGSRVAFVTRANGIGDIGSWTDDPDDSGLAAADSVCQSEAEDAGLEGTFVAFLGVQGQADPRCRLLGGHGLVADACGFAEEIPGDDGVFIDAAGRPVAFGVDAVVAEEWRLPIRYFADGSLVPHGTFAWLGAHQRGEANGIDCDGWTDGSGARSGAAAYGVESMFLRHGNNVGCDLASVSASWTFHLLCFQVGADFYPASKIHERTGKRVFITSTSHEAAMGGPIGGDAVCQAAAAEAGLDAIFTAWLSDANDDAYCRLAGATGKRADGCGLEVLPDTGPWVRPDGFLVAEDLDDLTDGLIEAPIVFDEHGDRLLFAHAQTGTTEEGTRRMSGNTPLDCQGWTSSSSDDKASGGTATSAGRSWTQYFSSGCSGAFRLVCFER